MRILVVDDDPDMLAWLALHIEQLGHEVVTASGGVEGLRALDEHNTLVVLLDWMMPEMDGLAVTRELRGRAGQPYVYIIMMTVLAGKQNYLAGMDAGADDFVTKPVDFDVLRARLRVAERVLALQTALMGRRGVLPICMYCNQIRDEQENWHKVEKYLTTRANARVSHGLCPTCYAEKIDEWGIDDDTDV